MRSRTVCHLVNFTKATQSIASLEFESTLKVKNETGSTHHRQRDRLKIVLNMCLFCKPEESFETTVGLQKITPNITEKTNLGRYISVYIQWREIFISPLSVRVFKREKKYPKLVLNS